METTKITKLPSMEHPFSINVKGKESQRYYEGTFKYKRLSLGRRLESQKLQVKLLENIISLPDDPIMYAEMVSYLRYGLIEYPKWWRECGYGLGDDFYDLNVVTALYKECQKFETDWEKKIYGDPDEDKVLTDKPSVAEGTIKE